MGLFSFLFNTSKQSRIKTAKYAPSLTNTALHPQHQLMPWNIDTPTVKILLTGTSERPIYIYDPNPLQGIRKGSRIELEVFIGDAIMIASTGTVRDTRNRKYTNSCVLYQGQPVGFVSIPPGQVRRAAKNGFALTMIAKSYGKLANYDGIPEIKAALPERITLEDIRKTHAESENIPENCRSISYNEYDEVDFRNIVMRDTWFFPNARLDFIPVPKGSSAKPHIGVYSAKGVLISEVAAKNRCYKELAQITKSHTNFYASATRWKTDEGKTAYRITIQYW